MSNKYSTRTRVALIPLLTVLMGFLVTAQAADDDWPPKVSSDGMPLVEGTKVDAVWVKEGADFSEYNRVMIMDAGVGFIKHWRRDYNRDEISLERQVSKADAERIKHRVADEFKKVFTEELEKAGYEVSDYDFNLAEADTLVLRPAIIDLDVTAPDVESAGMGRSYSASAGAMTLYLEFYDSVTSSILGRVIDRENARDDGMVTMSNRVTNKSEADRMFRKWTGLLIKKMDTVMGKED